MKWSPPKRPSVASPRGATPADRRSRIRGVCLSAPGFAAAPADMSSVLDPKALGRLKWRCRRGLLENDLFLERFFVRHGDALTPQRAHALEALIALPDNDLLDLLLARCEPEGALDRAPVRELLALLRAPDFRPPEARPT